MLNIDVNQYPKTKIEKTANAPRTKPALIIYNFED